jgi:hypothetical protein
MIDRPTQPVLLKHQRFSVTGDSGDGFTPVAMGFSVENLPTGTAQCRR